MNTMRYNYSTKKNSFMKKENKIIVQMVMKIIFQQIQIKIRMD